MTILLRVDANRDEFPDAAELERFTAWLESIGGDQRRIRAVAIEAPDYDLPGLFYVVHLTEYVYGPDGRPARDPATGDLKLTYRTVHLSTWSWPGIRAVRAVDAMID